MATVDALRLELAEGATAPFNKRSFAQFGLEIDDTEATLSSASSAGASSSGAASSSQTSAVSASSSGQSALATMASSSPAGPSEPKRARGNPDAIRGALRIDVAGPGSLSAATASSSSLAASRSRSRAHSSPSSASPSPSQAVGPSAASGLIAFSASATASASSSSALVPPGRRRVRRTHRSAASTTPTNSMPRPVLELSLPEIPSLYSLEPLIDHQQHQAASHDPALLAPAQLWAADVLTASPSPTPTPAGVRGDPLIEIPSDPMLVDGDSHMNGPAQSNSLNLALGFTDRTELDLRLPALDAIVRTREHWHQQDISSSSSSSPSLAADTRPATPPVLSLSLDINISTDSLFSDLGSDQARAQAQVPPPPPRFDASYRLRQRPQELSDDLPLPSPPLRPVVPARAPRSELVRSGFWSSGVRERRQPQQPPPPVPALPIMAAPLQMPDAEISQPQPQEAQEEELEEPVIPRSRDRLHLIQSGFWSSGRRERRERDRLRDPAQQPPMPSMPPLPGSSAQPEQQIEQEPEPVAGSSSSAAQVEQQQQQQPESSETTESEAAVSRRERLHRQRSGFWSSGYRERRQPRNTPPVPPMPDPPVLPPPIVTTHEPLLPPISSSRSLRDSFPQSSTSMRDSLPADFRQRVHSPAMHTASTTGTWDPLASPLRPTPTTHTPPRLDFDITPSYLPSLPGPSQRARDSMPPSLPMPLELPTSIELPPMIPPPDFLTPLSTELDSDPLEREHEHEQAERAPSPPADRSAPVPPSLPPLDLGDLAMEASGSSTSGARNRASDPGARTLGVSSALSSPTSPLRSSRYSHNLGLLDLSLDEPWNGIANSLRLPAEPVLQPLTVSLSPRSSMSLSSDSSPTGARHSLQRASTFSAQRNSLGEGPSGVRHSTSSFHTSRLSMASNTARHSSGSMFSGHSHTRPPLPSRPSSSGNGASSATTATLRRSQSGRPMGPRDAAPTGSNFPWYSGSGSSGMAGPSRFATPLSLSRASPAPPAITHQHQHTQGQEWVPAYNPDEDDSHSGSDSDRDGDRAMHRPHAVNARRRMGTRSPTPMDVDHSPGLAHLTLAPMALPAQRSPSPQRLHLPLPLMPTARPRFFGESASSGTIPRLAERFGESSSARLELPALGHASSSRYASATVASTSRRAPSPVRNARPLLSSQALRTAFHPVRPAAPSHSRSFSASSSNPNSNNGESAATAATSSRRVIAPPSSNNNSDSGTATATTSRARLPPSSFHPHPIPARQRTVSSSRAQEPVAPTLPQLDFVRGEGSSSSAHRHSMHAASTPSVQQTHIGLAPAQPTPPMVSRSRRIVVRQPSEDSISEDNSSSDAPTRLTRLLHDHAVHDAPNRLSRLLQDMSSAGSGSGATTTERWGESQFALGRPTVHFSPRRTRRRDAVDDHGLASPTGTNAAPGPGTPGASGRLWGVPRMNRGDYIDDATWDPSYENLMRLAAQLGEAKPKGVPANIIANLPSGMYKDFADAEGDSRCPICLEDYLQTDEVMRLTECPHWMHKGCLQQWLHNARSCPVCRMRVNVVRYSCGSTSATESMMEAGPSHLAQRRALTSRFIQESRNINVRMMHADVHGWPSMD